MNPHKIPAIAGTYVLILQLDTTLTTQVGRLGQHMLERGLYAYVGSAHGSGGLRARVGRHLRQDKKLHWHIDMLATSATTIGVWYRAVGTRLECAWASTLASLPGTAHPIAGFGASDCNCIAHLINLPAGSLRTVWEALDSPDVLPADFWALGQFDEPIV